MRPAQNKKSRSKRTAKAVRKLKAFLRGAAVMLAAAALIAGALYAGGMAYEAEALRIAHVSVSGCSADIAESVLAAAEQYRGQSILAADMRSFSRALEEMPWIDSVTVRKQIPDTLAIRIVAREARAIIMLDEAYLVDQHGNIFTSAPEHWPSLPVLSGLEYRAPEHSAPALDKMIAAGLEVIEGLHAQRIPADGNVRITFNPSLGITLKTAPNSADIFLGLDDYRQKIAVLPLLLADLQNRGLSAQHIHLNSYERAYVTLEEAPQAHRRVQAYKSPAEGISS